MQNMTLHWILNEKKKKKKAVKLSVYWMAELGVFQPKLCLAVLYRC